VLATLSLAVVPLSLVTIGLSLQEYGVRGAGRAAVGLALAKLVLHPLLIGVVAWVFGLHGLPMVVAVLCAGLPTGANVLLFANRYGTQQAESTAVIVLTTLLFPVTATLTLLLLGPVR
jgi:predicted permease